MIYNQTGIECSYIHNLLRNTYIPTIPYYKEDILTNTTLQEKLPYDYQFIVNDKIYIKRSNGNIEYLRTIKENEYIPGVTTNYFTHVNYYDSNTHNHFGDYLRYFCYKNNVHLMSLYNCFSNQFIDNSKLPLNLSSHNHIYVDNADTNIIAIKVKYNTNYTIRLLDENIVYSQLAYFDGNKFCNMYIDKTKAQPFILTSTYKTINVFYDNPTTYAVPSAETFVTATNNILKQEQLTNILNAEKYLYLLLELKQPLKNIVITEVEDENLNLNNSLIKDKFNLKPVSDKLLSYILDIAISPATTIHKNITRIQEQLHDVGIRDINNNVYKLNDYSKGVFDYNTASFIYNIFRTTGISDFLGYVDKDVEDLIYKGVNYGSDK